ncbi:hypothetical protein [Kineococcus aurantiacus]|uniref:GAF domain-containing protein n=1 Tax=Kineococcus aurantiacus TaxID=37633 RepID=A0A7Y9DQ95_9ACTN|nr:hypothetical protein [Kineococcus aurantiacus]NYD24749.1 hypothetical protein [Kineococcus aurantiacus]
MKLDRIWLDVGTAVLAAVVGAALALDRAGVWVPSDPLVVTLVVVTALLAIVPAVLQAVSTARGRRAAAARELWDDLLSGALWAVVDASAADPRDLALAGYRLDASRRRPARLSRVHRVRARRRPAASGVRWAPGKGVIGECVATGTVVARDVTALDAAGERQGLTPEEFRLVRGKYAVVVAVPLVDDAGASSAVTGCLALDGPPGSLEQLTTPEVLGVLEATSRALQRLTGGVPVAAPLGAAPGADRLRAALERQASPADRVAAVGGAR